PVCSQTDWTSLEPCQFLVPACYRRLIHAVTPLGWEWQIIAAHLLQYGPHMMRQYPTLPQRLLDAVDRIGTSHAQMYRTNGKWERTCAQEMLRRIAGLSAALSSLGIGNGDRVAVFAPNCPEWHVADFAILGLGAVTVPIYFRESADRIEYIVSHS